MKAKEVLKICDISRNTLCNWVKNNKIGYVRLPSGRLDYKLNAEQIKEEDRSTILYARVSTTAQKENLKRQIERLKLFCSAKGIIVDEVLFDVASALNYKRSNYNKLIQEIISRKVKRVVCEYKDRILRIGFEDFERLCEFFKVELIIIDNAEIEKTKQQEITEDLISIIHHFSMRIYSSRKRKKIIELIKEKR